MQRVLSDKNVSHYYSGGFERCDFEELTFACVAGLGSYPVESWLLHLLEDDRLAKH